MATKVKGKIGKRIARRAKAGKSVDIGLGPGMASLAGKSAATKLAALAKRISAAKKLNAKVSREVRKQAKGSTLNEPGLKNQPAVKQLRAMERRNLKAEILKKEAKAKKKMIKVSVKGPISSTITDAGTKAAVAARKAKRAALQAKMDKSNKQAVKLKKEIAAKKAKTAQSKRIESRGGGERLPAGRIKITSTKDPKTGRRVFTKVKSAEKRRKGKTQAEKDNEIFRGAGVPPSTSFSRTKLAKGPR